MKNILIVVALTFLAFSCSIEKRLHRKGYNINTSSFNNSKTNDSKEKEIIEKQINLSEVNNQKNKVSSKKSLSTHDVLDNSNTSNKKKSIEKSGNTELLIDKKVKPLNDSYLGDNECDIIILKDGTEIKAKVLEINEDDIKYKMCSNLDGPTMTKRKDLIFMIKYPNGTSYVVGGQDNSVKTKTNIEKADTSKKEFEPLAVIGFSFLLLEFLILLLEILVFAFPIISFLLGITGVILLMISSKKFKNNPNKYRGKGFLIAGMVLSILSTILGTLYLIEWLYYFG